MPYPEASHGACPASKPPLASRLFLVMGLWPLAAEASSSISQTRQLWPNRKHFIGKQHQPQTDKGGWDTPSRHDLIPSSPCRRANASTPVDEDHPLVVHRERVL